MKSRPDNFADPCPPSRSTLRGYMAALAVGMVALAVWAPTLPGGFILDDGRAIVANRALGGSPGDQVRLLIDRRAGAVVPFADRPLATLTFALNRRMGDVNPFGYRVINLLIHAAAAGLLTMLAGELFRVAGFASAGPASLIAGLLFAVHPLAGGTAAYVSGRPQGMAALFVLAALLGMMRGVLRANIAWFIAAGAAFACGLGSHESAAAFVPIAMVLLGVTLRDQYGPAVGRGWLATAAAAGMLTIWLGWYLWWHQGLSPASRVVTASLPGITYLFLQPYVIVSCMWRALMPVSAVLAAPYCGVTAWWGIKSLAAGVGSAVFVLFSIFLAGSSRRARRVLFLLTGWFPATLAVSGLFFLPATESALYLPLAGLALVAAFPLAAAWQRVPRSRAAWVLCAVLAGAVCLLASQTVRRADVFRDDRSAYAEAVRADPGRADLRAALAAAYARAGEYRAALANYGEALAINPRLIQARLGTGEVFIRMKDYQSAVFHLDKAVALMPFGQEAYYLLGTVYEDLGERDRAAHYYRTALSIDPTHSRAHAHLGFICYSQGQYPQAVAELSAAAGYDPQNAQVFAHLGALYADLGENERAVEFLKQAVSLEPSRADLHLHLGALYAQAGKYQRAREEYQRAEEIAPGLPEAEEGLARLARGIARDPAPQAASGAGSAAKSYTASGLMHQSQGEYTQAEASFRSALAYDPRSVSAHNALGMLLRSRGRYREAAVAFERAVALDPSSLTALSNLGQAYLLAGSYEPAVAALRQAAALAPEHPIVRMNLGNAYYKVRDYARALPELERAVKLGINNADIHLMLGRIRQALGDSSRALQEFTAGLCLDPRNPALTRAVEDLERGRKN